MDELLKKFTVEAMTEIINQTKTDQSFITDTFFKNGLRRFPIPITLSSKKARA